MSNSRWIVKYFASVKWVLLIGMLCNALEAASFIALTGIQKFIIDDVFIGNNFDILVPLLIGLGSLAVIYNLLHLYAAYVKRKGMYVIQQTMLKQMYDYLQWIPVRLFRKERTAKYVQHMTRDVEEASSTIANLIPAGAMYFSQVIILSVIIWLADPIILISILLISIVYIGFGRYFGPRLRAIAKETQQEKTHFITTIEEGISSSREVIAFHRQQWEKDRLLQRFERYFTKVMHENKISNTQILISQPLRWLVQLIVLGYGGYCVIQGSVSIGLFVIVFQFSTQFIGACENVYRFFINLWTGYASVDRIRSVLDGEVERDGEEQLVEAVHELTFSHVSFRYESSDQLVLHDVSFTIPIGQKSAFVGSSGGGKSTIAQLIVRFYDAQTGEICVNGLTLSKISRKHWLNKVSIVFQEPYLFPNSIRNNLLLGRDISEKDMELMCRKMHIHDFIESLPDGYDTEVGERGIKLSGGQRQRLALARALLGNPELLILDEATSALDLETERLIMNSLDELRNGKTTIVIAHRLSTVIDAEVIFVMHEGQIREQGTHESLLEKGEIYRQLIHVDIQQGDIA